MKRTISKLTAVLSAGLMLLSAIPAAAQETADSVTLPSGKTVGEVDRELQDYAQEFGGDEPRYASAAVGIFRGDEVLYTGCFGTEDIAAGTPADENSVYEWGSISKTLIWVSAMQLYEQGKLDLERDVRDYLPEGFFQHLTYDDPITMLDLMEHKAGFQETTRPIFRVDGEEIGSLKDELQAIEPAQVNRPGEVAAYSNYGAAVAGYVVECVSGVDFCEYVHENIFEPLGMERTALAPAHDDNSYVFEKRRVMKSYSRLFYMCVDQGPKLEYLPCYPAGAATGTLGDLMTYAQALADKSAPLFQSPETQELMFSGTDFYGSSDIPLNAHGFWFQERAVRTVGHNGATVFGQANMEIDLESGIGLVCMVNEQSGNYFLSETPSLVFGYLSPDKYSSGSVQDAGLDGHYLMARSYYRGMFRIVPYLQSVSGLELTALDNGLYQMVSYDPEQDISAAMLLGERNYPDGSSGLSLPSEDLLPEKLFVPKLMLFAAYVLAAVVSIYMIRIQLKLRKHGRHSQCPSTAAMTAAQCARLVSLLSFLVLISVFMSNTGGASYGWSAAVGILEMACCAVCGVSAAATLVPVVAGKRKGLRLCLSIASIAVNILSVAAILYFEMYRFWDM